MDFHLKCSCGNTVVVTEAAAEGAARCPCGQAVPVPPLTELRRQAGLPAYNISPELEIEYLLEDGATPGGKTCVRCGTATDDRVLVVTECERSWTKQRGG